MKIKSLSHVYIMVHRSYTRKLDDKDNTIGEDQRQEGKKLETLQLQLEG